jgi:hypothetical protein
MSEKPTATATPVIPGQDLFDLRDTLTAAAALGLPVPAPALTRAVDVIVHGWDYDDPDVSLGVFQSKESALIALRNFVIERHDETEDCSPWGMDISGDDYTDATTYNAAYDRARSAWLNGKTDEEVIATMFDESMYFFTEVRIEPDPERMM